MEDSSAAVPKDVSLSAGMALTDGGRPPPSPLSGGYLLIVISEPHTDAHKAVILQKLTKGVQDHFGVGIVAGIELSIDESQKVYVTIYNLYAALKNDLATQRYEVEGLDDWIRSDTISVTRNCELDKYLQWVRDGAKMLANANQSKQEGKFDDLFKEAKSKILEIIPADSKPGAATSINEVLDSLNFALAKCITMEDAETAGTKLDKNEGRNVFMAIVNLYADLKNNLNAQDYEVEGLDDWIFNNKKNMEQIQELDKYLQWVRDGAKMLANANQSEQGGELDDRIEEAKSKILEIIPENIKPGAAVSINEVLDNLKTALNKCLTIEEVTARK